MIHLISEDFVAPLYDSIHASNSLWHLIFASVVQYILVSFKISHELGDEAPGAFPYVFGSICSIFFISSIFFSHDHKYCLTNFEKFSPTKGFFFFFFLQAVHGLRPGILFLEEQLQVILMQVVQGPHFKKISECPFCYISRLSIGRSPILQSRRTHGIFVVISVSFPYILLILQIWIHILDTAFFGSSSHLLHLDSHVQLNTSFPLTLRFNSVRF